MNEGVHLTLMIGPVMARPVSREILDALTEVSVTNSGTASEPSRFTLTFTIRTRSPLHTLFLLSGGAQIPIMRVIIVVTINGTPNVLMDGVVTNQQVAPGSTAGSPTLTVSGDDLTAVMNLAEALANGAAAKIAITANSPSSGNGIPPLISTASISSTAPDSTKRTTPRWSAFKCPYQHQRSRAGC